MSLQSLYWSFDRRFNSAWNLQPMNKKLTEMSMIVLIGTSPLCFEYLKQNISSTGIIDKLQSDLNKYS